MADSVIGRLVYKIVGDDREYQKALKRSKKALDRAGQEMQQVGRKLTLGLTAPIVGLGAAFIKAAVDAEETAAKFGTAFRGIESDAGGAVQNLQENYGLAADEAQRLLAGTGDLLKGFGASADQALGLSEQVQTLAVDLASYNNLAGGTSAASEAITKALLGEREQLKQLGVVIRQTDVDQRLLEKGQADLTGQARLLAQSQATLELIMEQSGDAIGDYARTSDSAANQMRLLKARVRDLSVELGQELLPMFEAILSNTLELVKNFSELDDGQKKVIVRSAAFVAALGPMVTVVGSLTRAAAAAKIALAALAANPIVLAITGATAGVLALGRAIDKAIDRQRAEDMERFADAAERTGRSATDIANQYADAEIALAQQLSMGGDLAEAIRNVSEQYRVSLDGVVDIARTLPQVTDEHSDILDALAAEADTTEEIVDVTQEQIEHVERQAMAESQISDAIKEQLEARVRVNSLTGEQVSLADQLRTIDELIASGVYDEEEGLERKIKLREEEIERMQEAAGYDSLSEAQRKAALEQLGDRIQLQQEEIDRYKTRLDIIKQTNDERSVTEDYTERQLRNLDAAEQRHRELEKTTDRWYQSMIDDAASWDDVMQSTVDALIRGYGHAFEIFGAGFVEGQLALEDMKEAAKSVAISILRALGQEYAIRAAVALIPGLTFNPAAASGFAAASAAAYTAAGVVSAFGEGGSFYADQPQLIMVGDKPEMVRIEPVQHAVPPGTGAGTNITIVGDVYGYEDFAQRVEQAKERAGRLGRVGR